MLKRIIIGTSILIYCLSFSYSQDTLTGQRSIAMLNYLASQAVSVIESKDSKLLLEDLYQQLYNNVNPEDIDQDTQRLVLRMLNQVENIRLVSVQRDRLQYLLEREQAQAIYNAIPDTLGIIGTVYMGVKRGDLIAGVASAIGLTAQSLLRVKQAQGKNDIEFMKQNWALDDKNSRYFHELRTDVLEYLWKITDIYHLPKTDSLNEKAIKNFFTIQHDSNRTRKLQNLKNGEALYSKYAPYWLELANVYYENAEWQKCIDAIERYEKAQSNIFRKDFDYAHVLTKRVVALQNLYMGKDSGLYLELVGRSLKIIEDNIEVSDSLTYYFVAMTYLNMASIENNITNKQAYLDKAYSHLVHNVSMFSRASEEQIAAYLNPIQIPQIDKIQLNSKEKVKDMEKRLIKERKTELPPFNSLLILNYNTLFNLMNEMNISTTERTRINALVNDAFINPFVREKYLGETSDSFENAIKLKKVWIPKYFWTIIIIFTSICGIVGFITGFIWGAGMAQGPGVILGFLIGILIAIIFAKFSPAVRLTAPASFFTTNSTIDMEFIETSGNVSVYKRNTLKWSVDGKVKRDKNGTTTLDTGVVLYIKTPKYPKIKKDSEYKIKVLVTLGDYSGTMVFTCPVGKKDFKFIGLE